MFACDFLLEGWGMLWDLLGVEHGSCMQGCERSVITYSSLISACEKAGDWKLALEFFDECTKDNCRPNVITFNSLISACSQGVSDQAQSVLILANHRGVANVRSELL